MTAALRPLLLAAVLLLTYSAASFRAAAPERTFHREEVRIGALPAWLMLPVPPPGRLGPPEVPEPRPLVIVQHGFSASRHAMGWLSWGLVRNGFAVLAGDFRGHGQNRTPFNRGDLNDDIAALIDYARRRPEVDADRVALIGHSMGAYAVYDFAVRRQHVDAVIPISGSGLGGTRERPRNVLLIDASGDPERIRRMSEAAMRRLTGDPGATLGVTYGDLAAGTARRFVRVGGHDHLSILFSNAPMREIVAWLRDTWSLREQPFRPAPVSDAVASGLSIVAGLLLIFPLAGFLAVAVGVVQPARGAPIRGGVWMAGLAAVAGGSVLFGGTPLSFMPYTAGNELVSLFLVAGAVYAVWYGWQRRPPSAAWPDTLRAAALGVLAFGVIYATFGTALARVLFNLTLDSQRAAWFVLVALAFLPLGIGLEAALRPGGGWRSIVRGLAAKALVLAGLSVTIFVFGTLPPVIGLMVPSLALVFPVIEAVAARLYAVSGSPVASGVLTALFLAWIPAAIFPIGN